MKIKHSFILIILSFLLLACDNQNEIANIDDPELVAIEFFNALYNEKNLKKATSVCSPKLSRIINHYKSPNAVARHVFNMSYDKVTITPDDSGVTVRKQYSDTANVTLYFDGTFNGNKLKDVKRISLKKIKERWIIVKLLKDPF